jgi:hypothetical protein
MYAFVDLKGGIHHDVFSDKSVPNRYNGCYGYHFSKLFLMLWSRELASRVDPSQVIVGDSTPGCCETPLFGAPGHGTWLGKFLLKLASRTAEEGAILYIFSIFLSTKEEFHDGYFAAGKLSK